MRATSRARQWNGIWIVSLLLAACSGNGKDDRATSSTQELRTSHWDDWQDEHEKHKCVFGALLTGRAEVPPRETPALAAAVIKSEGDELRYQLYVTHIDNVIASHIHLGAPGENGPVVAFLAGPFPPGGGPISGLLAEGTITADDLVGPLAGQPLWKLLAAMKHFGAYVNVHTNDGVDPADTGPGDFPAGEIRGEVVVVRCTGKRHRHHDEDDGHEDGGSWDDGHDDGHDGYDDGDDWSQTPDGGTDWSEPPSDGDDWSEPPTDGNDWSEPPSDEEDASCPADEPTDGDDKHVL